MRSGFYCSARPEPAIRSATSGELIEPPILTQPINPLVFHTSLDREAFRKIREITQVGRDPHWMQAMVVVVEGSGEIAFHP